MPAGTVASRPSFLRCRLGGINESVGYENNTVISSKLSPF